MEEHHSKLIIDRDELANLHNRLSAIESFKKDILDSDTVLREVKLDVEALKLRTFAHDESAIVHRTYSDKKLQEILDRQDSIFSQLTILPCSEREAWYKGMNAEVLVLKWLTGGVLFSLFAIVITMVISSIAKSHT